MRYNKNKMRVIDKSNNNLRNENQQSEELESKSILDISNGSDFISKLEAKYNVNSPSKCSSNIMTRKLKLKDYEDLGTPFKGKTKTWKKNSKTRVKNKLNFSRAAKTTRNLYKTARKSQFSKRDHSLGLYEARTKRRKDVGSPKYKI